MAISNFVRNYTIWFSFCVCQNFVCFQFSFLEPVQSPFLRYTLSWVSVLPVNQIYDLDAANGMPYQLSKMNIMLYSQLHVLFVILIQYMSCESYQLYKLKRLYYNFGFRLEHIYVWVLHTLDCKSITVHLFLDFTNWVCGLYFFLEDTVFCYVLF